MRTRGALLFANIITGLALGYVVTNIGFGDYAELNRMFTFQDLRMFFAFAGAVAIIVVIFGVVGVRRQPGRIHAGVVPGAVLFGTGWAISGGCPRSPSSRSPADTCPPSSRSPVSWWASGCAAGPTPSSSDSTEAHAGCESFLGRGESFTRCGRSRSESLAPERRSSQPRDAG